MKTHLVKIGDEYAVLLDDAMLEHLKVGPDTPLMLETRDGSLLVRPACDDAPTDHDATDPGDREPR